MDALLGDSPALQNRRLRRISLGLSLLCLSLVFILILVLVFYRASEECDCNGFPPGFEKANKSTVLSGVLYWTGSMDIHSPYLAIASGLRDATRRRLSELLGGPWFAVRVNDSVVRYNFQTGEVNRVLESSTETLYMNKTCTPPAKLVDDVCEYFPGVKGSWYEAYSRCDLLGLKISHNNKRLYRGNDYWYSPFFGEFIGGAITSSLCYERKPQCANSTSFAQVSQGLEAKLGAEEKLFYVCEG